MLVEMPGSTVKKRRGNFGRNRALSPEREAELVAEYLAGIKDMQTLQADYGVSHQTIYNAVDRAPEKVRRTRRAS